MNKTCSCAVRAIGVTLCALCAGVLAACTGCGGSHANRTDFAGWVRAGFRTSPARVFVSATRWDTEDRLSLLLKKVQPCPELNLSRIEHCTDGQCLRFRSVDGTQVVVFEAGREPRLTTCPPYALLTDAGKVIAWPAGESKYEMWCFPAGQELFLPNLVADGGGSFLCTGGRYFDYRRDCRGEVPIIIRDAAHPETVLCETGLGGIPQTIHVADSQVYVTSAQGEGALWSPTPAECEVYDVTPEGFVLARAFEIRSPSLFADWVAVKDFDPVQGLFLVYVHACMPYRPFWCVYDLRTGRLNRLRNVGLYAYVGFLDPNVFDSVLAANATPAGDGDPTDAR